MRDAVETAHRFLEKSKHPNRLQEVIQVVMEGCRRAWSVDVGVQFLSV